MMTYQGHKNWNHWSVCLWLHNDESLYRLMQAAVIGHDTKDGAAHTLLRELADAGITHTPDGAPYSFTTIRAAMRGEV